jgi:hypothetical protein
VVGVVLAGQRNDGRGGSNCRQRLRRLHNRSESVRGGRGFNAPECDQTHEYRPRPHPRRDGGISSYNSQTMIP